MVFAQKSLLSIFLLIGLCVNAQVSTKNAIQDVWLDTTKVKSLDLATPIKDAMWSLYDKGNYQPVFTHGMQEMYLDYLQETALLGFVPENYNSTLLDSLSRSKNPEHKALLDMKLCESYLKFYDDVLNGVLKNEKTRGGDIHFSLESYEVSTTLQAIQELPSINYLKLIEPQIEAYKYSKKVLLHFIADSSKYASDLRYVDTLRLGDRDSLVIQLRKRLYFLGDLKVVQKLRSPIFDKDVLLALNTFKQRHLLAVDSILDSKTTKLLNTPIEDRVQELQFNLERWRWLPISLGDYYAFANLPSFEMSLIKNDTLLLKQRMVCGKVSRNTPAFSDTMRYLDINPTWTVPPTILQKDILPSAQNNSAYLSRKNIRVLDVATGTYISSSEINWANSKNYKFVQGPGLSNSLGVVKFIYPNPYYIFFHDTPHKEHFPLTYRAYSSGCIRLEQPRKLAEVLLKYNTVSYTEAQIDSIVDTRKTKRVLLSEMPVVFISYLTQDFQDGVLYQYPDIYGYNKILENNF